MRFSASAEAADSLIPGIVFSKLEGRFKSSTQLPVAQFPKVLRESQAELAYLATTSLEAENFRLLVGGRSAIVSFVRPYPGWSQVLPTVLECFGAVLDTTLVKNVERFSIKYTNVVGSEDHQYDLEQLNVKLKLNGFALRGPGAQIRAETEHNDCITIIQVQSGVTVTLTKPAGIEKATGLGVFIDTINMGPFDKGRDQLPDTLEHLHQTAKEVYFSLLTGETLSRLGPSDT